ncbi:MAG: LacI family DNA-binding transcriptional regulator [Culicoidibacterales bacterium]
MTNQPPKSIVEIAQLAGVSKSTVSRVLNNTGYVSEQSREKVLTVVRATGFMVNAAAKTLKTQRQDTIAVIIPRIESQAVAQMVKGINLELAETNTNIVLGITNLEQEKELYYLQYFSQQGVQGIIFMARQITQAHEEIIRKSPVPIVILAQKADFTQSVAFDEFDGAKQVALALFERDDQVGYIGVSTDDYAIGIERLAGVQAAAKHKKKHLTFELGDFTARGGYQAAKRLLERKPQIRGIIAATDTIAVGVMEYLREQHIQIGPEIAVAAFGDSPFTDMIQPKLASVHYPYVEAGAIAVKRIFTPVQPQQTILLTHFITRASCK